MMPGINSGISDERNFEKHMERQMGCMTGFFQLFDRPQIMAGKRFYSTKRLPSSPTSDSLSPSESSDLSSTSFVKAAPPSPPSPSSPSPGTIPSSPDNHHPTRTPLSLPLPVFEVKDGVKTSWKLRETPRLSLDSLAVFDDKGKLRPREIRTSPVISGDQSDCTDAGLDLDKQRRSPSLVARLMGLDALPVDCIEEQLKKSELRRSASESRVSHDRLQVNFQKPSPISEEFYRSRKVDRSEIKPRNSLSEPPQLPPVSLQRSFFEAKEFFPEPKRTESMYGDMEKRLHMRGIEDPAKDLETLKQIFEALQLKGLLRTKPLELPALGRFDAINNHMSPISVMTASPVASIKPSSKSMQRSAGIEQITLPRRSFSPRRAAASEVILPAKSRKDPCRKSLTRPPETRESSRSPIGSPVRRRLVNPDPQRTPQPERRISPGISPVARPRRPGSYQLCTQSPRNWRRKPEVSSKEMAYPLAEDDVLAFSDTSPDSQFDFENIRIEECSTGRSILERCDKLLHSIAAITSSADQVTVTDQQPSPVSVLDSNFLSDEIPASPHPKRSIEFNDQIADWEDHRKIKATSGGSEFRHGLEAEINAGQGDDYAYVADVVRETDRHGGPTDIFSSLEQRYKTTGASTVSVLYRRLVFDTVTEIVSRKRNVSPWVAFTYSPSSKSSMLPEVWEEVQCLQEHAATENVMELAGKAVRQDMAATAGVEQEWTVMGVEMSAAVLHIERLLFKDLVADAIQVLAALAGKRRATTVSRRKLLF